MDRYVFRFSLGQRLLHGLLILSFLGLVGTGMPLLYNQAGWALWLAHTVGGYRTLGFFHRVNAVLLTLAFLIHLGVIARQVIGERRLDLLWGPHSLVPRPKDVSDFVRHVGWFLGLSARPRFDRFTYWEKFDYWAVFWGMAIIGTSGYMLWFPTVFAKRFPGWIFNVALLVHGEEALLAAGFIFTIHFFNSHLRPEKFPMDTVIFTGRVTEAELRAERPEEHDRLAREGRLAAIAADPPPRWMRNFALIVGSTAVAVGLTLFVLILIGILGG